MDIMPPKSDSQLRSMKVLEHRKVRDHTTISSGIEPVALTTDPVRQLRQIMVSCYETGVAEGVDITKLGFFVDHQEKFATQDWNAIQYMNAGVCKLNYRQVINKIQTSAATHTYKTMIPNVSPIFTPEDTGSEDAYITTTGDQVSIVMGSGENGVLVLHSDVIPRCAFIDFDASLTMRNLVSRNVLDLTLKMTQGAAGGAVEIHEQNIAPAIG